MLGLGIRLSQQVWGQVFIGGEMMLGIRVSQQLYMGDRSSGWM